MKDELHFSPKFKHKIVLLVILLSKRNDLFPISNIVSNMPFDLVHCDIWGPFTPMTVQGHKYFLTIVDDKDSFYMDIFPQRQI